MNASLAKYLAPVSADIAPIDIVMLDRPDFVASPILGAKSCGEIGDVGIAAAIASAAFNATGMRVRDLSITLDKLVADGTTPYHIAPLDSDIPLRFVLAARPIDLRITSYTMVIERGADVRVRFKRGATFAAHFALSLLRTQANMPPKVDAA